MREGYDEKVAIRWGQGKIPRKVYDLPDERGMWRQGAGAILDDLTDRATRDARAFPLFKGRTRPVARAQQRESVYAMETEVDRDRAEIGKERFICGDPNHPAAETRVGALCM